MAVYAMVENNIVINTIIWDGDYINNPLNLPATITLVLIPAGTIAGIGYTYDATGGVFTAPPVMSVTES
jgi:hypothetical protein